MQDLLAKTRYRVAQHWRFRCDTPEARDILVIVGVENHPTQGIICEVNLEYEPPIEMAPGSLMTGGEYWFTQDALDRSVTELVQEKGCLPDHFGTTGEFRISPESWARRTNPKGDDETVAEVLEAETEGLRQMRERFAVESNVPPKDPYWGAWSTIVRDQVEVLANFLEADSAFHAKALIRDEADEFSPLGHDGEHCFPLMLAAQCGSIQVADLLIRNGADPNLKNRRGETALHFAGRATNRSEDPAHLVRLLCRNGADPNARDVDGQTPLTCGPTSIAVAKALIDSGARPTIVHALQLHMLDWVREELKTNPEVVHQHPSLNRVLRHLCDAFCEEATRRHGSEIRLQNGESVLPAEDSAADFVARMSSIQIPMADEFAPIDEAVLSTWRRRGEIERAVFEENRDLLDMAMTRGADVNQFSALLTAVQMIDTSLAEWLLTHGADPNMNVKRGLADYLPGSARTRSMQRLLAKFGAEMNPFEMERSEFEKERDRSMERFMDEFDLL